MWRTMWWSVVLSLVVVGCAENLPEPTGPDLGRQMLAAEPQLQGQPFHVLLDFETPTDTVFVSPTGRSARRDSGRAHTGGSALRITGDTTRLDVNLASLTSGSPFPGPWTLAGAWFYSGTECRITAICESHGQTLRRWTVPVPASAWTAVLMDIADLPVRATALRFEREAGRGEWLCDDVLVIDNLRHVLSVPESPALNLPAWSVQQRGLRQVIDSPGRIPVEISALPGQIRPCQVVEANPLRACFVQNDSTWAVYADGRTYANSDFRPSAGPRETEADLAAQHASPAEIEVIDQTGRLDRDSAGDRNNDGYNERWAAYRVKAAGPRLNLRITPQTPRLQSPVLEILSLPPGAVLVTMEGDLVNTVIRTDDGRVLIQLPGPLTRPTLVNITVR